MVTQTGSLNGNDLTDNKFRPVSSYVQIMF